ncbi:hypothetical protein LAZ44_12535 [Vibrio alginolyticus]|uniref:hypothetical protein n=2 Tax=Vibrionaceae TaxID=641 RepID=UPI001CDBA0DE|nr:MULTISPECIES: hypothetical protein [Vibrio]MCA2450726.1 hypothetical protein [Vibrio alginolyticus]MCA2474122.1 hypothetical protein [Vibrio alginolyticus]MDW2154148.1 hypothetical protein [Vibrio sp. 2092]MDW2230732.1 hypothetical protein [Vibrio sp. 2091]
MRRISKRYKSKLSRLYQIAKSNHMTLAELIELKRRGNEIDEAMRLKTKFNEEIDWFNFSLIGFAITFPLLSGSEKSVSLLCVCHDLNSFEQLQAKYGSCPDDIKVQILKELEDLDL